MTKRALLQGDAGNGALFVHEIIENEHAYHPALKITDVTDVEGIAAGWVMHADGTFTPYVPPLDAARAEQIRALRFWCGQTIAAGFMSAALGSPHAYGSSATDQENLGHDALDAVGADQKWVAPIWCADPKGVWARLDHTADQVRQVLADFRAMRAKAQGKLADLTRAVTEAPDLDTILAIAW